MENTNFHIQDQVFFLFRSYFTCFIHKVVNSFVNLFIQLSTIVSSPNQLILHLTKTQLRQYFTCHSPRFPSIFPPFSWCFSSSLDYMKNELSLQRGQGWRKGRLPPAGISSWPGPRLGPADRHEFNKTRRGGQKVYIWLDGYIYPSRKEAGKYVKHTSGRRGKYAAHSRCVLQQRHLLLACRTSIQSKLLSGSWGYRI